MPTISRRLNNLDELPMALDEIGQQLRFHTESGFTLEEASGYAGQLSEVQKILVPLWKERLTDRGYELLVDCDPVLGGFLRIRILPEGGDPVVVFAESYARFNSEMCDGSFHQYVYQRVLCYEDGLASGRVPL